MIAFLIFMGVAIAIFYGIIMFISVVLAYKKSPFQAGRRTYLKRWVKKNQEELDNCKPLQRLIKKHHRLLMMIWMQTKGDWFKLHQSESAWIPQCSNNLRAAMPRNVECFSDSNSTITVWTNTCHRMMGIILSHELKEAGLERTIPEGAWIYYIQQQMRKTAVEYYRPKIMKCDSEDKLYTYIKNHLSEINGQMNWIFWNLLQEHRQHYPEIVPTRFSSFMSWYLYQQKIRIPDINKRSYDLKLPGL